MPDPYAAIAQSSADPYSAIALSSPAGAPPPKGTLPNNGDTGEGPIARNVTSFENQASQIPGNLVKLLLAKHWPIVDAKDWKELGEDFKSLNPIVKSDGQTDWGATAANILPMLVDVKGGGISESPAANLVKGTADVAAPAVRAGARGVNTVLEKAPGTIGATAGAALGHATGIPGASEVGGAAGFAVGKEVLPKVRIPGEGFGFPNRVEGGPATVAPGEVASASVASEPAPQPSAANIPKRMEVWRDATRRNVPYAGEDYGKLQEATKATIDKAIPAEGDTLALNKRVTAQVENHLSQGNVEAAETVLDTAAKKANPKYAPPDRPRITPSVQNIRERIAQVNDAEAAPNRPTPDSMEDRALQQEMNQDLERHGWAAESAARREFIARNSTGVTKSELTGAAEKPVKYTKTPAVPSPGTGAVDDLTDLLQKSLDAAKKAKEQR